VLPDEKAANIVGGRPDSLRRAPRHHQDLIATPALPEAGVKHFQMKPYAVETLLKTMRATSEVA
jgi:hypothetical protein